METRTIQDNAATNAVTNQTTICVLGYGDILAASVKEVLGVGFDVVSIDNVQNLTELNAQTATIMVCDEVTLGALSESVQVSIVNKFAQFKWLVLTHNPDLYQWTLPVENWNKGAHYFTIRKPLNIEALKNKLKRIAIEMHSKETQLTLLKKIKEQNRLLKLQNQALEKLNASKGHFITRLIDKMHGPIRKIDATLKQLLRDSHVNDATHRAIESSYYHARQLESNLSNLMVLGQVETGAYAPNITHANLDTIVSGVKEGVDLVAKAKKIDFLLLKPHHLGHIKTDPNLLHHIFSNIIDSLILQSGLHSSITWELKLFDTALESVWESKHHPNRINKQQLDVLTHACFELAAAKGLLEKLGGKLIYSVHDQAAQVVVHLPTS